MSFPTIQIFACDHRKNVQWDLPYIRLGNFQSDSYININNDFEIKPYQLLLSEGAGIWYVWKHIAEFGNPKYVGFCHYRRFFGNANTPICDISFKQFNVQKLFTPYQQMLLLVQNNLDGIVPFKFCPLNIQLQQQCHNIKQQTKCISDHDGLGFTTEVINAAFDILLDETPDNMKVHMQQAFLDEKIYVCNIFSMKSELFDIYGKIVIGAMKKLISFCNDKDTQFFHKRWMGYILERFTSLVITAFQLNGYKFQMIPLITIDGWKHETFEKHIGI